jgi:UDP-GlcNAc:undecaprenyl-phosphate GlcNAc-1-phosphate transferase
VSVALVWTFVVAAAIAAAITPLVRRAAHRTGTLDYPGERRTHARSTPRVGGIGVAAGWIVAIAGTAVYAGDEARAVFDQTPLAPLMMATAIVFATGLWDDVRPLRPSTKVLAQLMAAAIVAGAGIQIERVTMFGTTFGLGWMATAATLVWIVGITNAFNLIDGLDGLAAGLALIAGATCAAVVLIRGDYATAIILVALLGALTGFLPYNFNPASIFLGDSGSLTIGFTLAVTAITASQKGATALAVAVPLLMFALPIADTASALARRPLHRLFVADHGHLHHRLMMRGLSHRTTVLVLYAVAICLSAVALLTMQVP